MKGHKGIITSIILIFLFACSSSGQKDKDLCDFEKVLCIKRTDNIEVRLDIEPKPLQAFRETAFIITIKGDEGLPNELLLDLNMPGMFMGKNQVILKRVEKNKYKGTGVIPRCPSGKTLWQADIFVPGEGSVNFKFHVK
ncbi:MAG: hypothetical protein ACK4TF_06215 [Thermodesulfovibrionales bacterium]